MGVDLLQQSLAQLAPLQEVAEVEDGGLVRQVFSQIQAHKTPDRFGLVEQVPRRAGPSQSRSSMPGSLKL